jgi:hypothetical protein
MLQRIMQCHVQSKASLGKLCKGQGKKILYYPGLSLNLRRHVVYQVCCYMTKRKQRNCFRYTRMLLQHWRNGVVNQAIKPWKAVAVQQCMYKQSIVSLIPDLKPDLHKFVIVRTKPVPLVCRQRTILTRQGMSL